ncbi:DNA mismatch repair protein MutS [Robiginitalea myxolifaciens]|uniref:DNA mismatch repair protein MutS n=1 Tax=Robiginitalea myxolifaciens TaxID=400055 RepID=A0A1I6FSE5_9FLAO|nr:DNA mismatch repair protein MutS [Robiginitalea myxolifaciens]SFR32880.1 DNA mismatch repair protein MutS [Robiginitalea myxolifaciens]
MAKKAKKETPLMQQYNSIKRRYPDALLLFRVGDFYETFGQDAEKAAGILDIVLTQRNNGGDKTALAGFPHHALNTYLPKLVRAGQRVAICDQLEDPKQTKTIVKRGVTELVTPGVSLMDDVLQDKDNNYLAAVQFGARNLGIAFLDISTGEFFLAEGREETIGKWLQNFGPKEVLIPRNQRRHFEEVFGSSYHTFILEEWIFQEDYAREQLTGHFKTSSLKGFGVESLTDGIIAAGAALHYLSETHHRRLGHIQSLRRLAAEDYVWMDRFTLRNLEVLQARDSEGVSLLDVLDQTRSPMGGRMLRRWLALPLKEEARIVKRQDGVAYFVKATPALERLRNQLKQMGDLERLIAKVATAKIGPRECVQLKNSLMGITPIQGLLKESDTDALLEISNSLDPCTPLIERIQQVLREEAPAGITKGGAIAEGFSEELDELRGLSRSGKDYLDQMLERESERTGIPSLKIASNNVFGYYIEVRNTHRDKVPEEWIRKQTLVNAERYITEELKEYEAKILGAEERILDLEQQLFNQLVSWLQEYIGPVQLNARLLAELDCLGSFAQSAAQYNYVRPEVHQGTDLYIEQGRHPVIERRLPPGEGYIANDLLMDRENQQILMITGPNMSGKSAILRQTALISLMAQAGSFVPANAARLGLIDKIFTRVGASDNISLGESTFMVEMNEAASILNNLSDRSLILLDEIGRGTSTYDGISIAWAIAEFLHRHPSRPKTLFATHYHELNEMENSFPRIRNFNVAVRELEDKVLFLRKLEAGGSHHSFGIHVARMAGMPQQVVQKAKKILKKLEASHSAEALEGTASNTTTQVEASMTNGEAEAAPKAYPSREQTSGALQAVQEDMQLSFFNLDDPLLESIREEILDLDIDRLTPVEALMKLNEIKRILTAKKRASS